MLFVSPHPGYQLLGIKQQKVERDPNTGEHISVAPGIDALFVHGGCPGWAQDEVINNPQFVQRWGGLPDDVPRHSYISVYDTVWEQRSNDWDDETRLKVEKTLLEHPDNGRAYIVIEPPSTTRDAPWPNYDATHYTTVVKVAKEIGADLNYVLEYERANKDRPSVIEAVQAELERVADDGLVAA